MPKYKLGKWSSGTSAIVVALYIMFDNDTNRVIEFLDWEGLTRLRLTALLITKGVYVDKDNYNV